MGGSDKIKGSNGRLPELKWSAKSYTPAEFPGCFSRPQVVRILPGEDEETENNPAESTRPVDLGPQLDTSKPFLIYSHRRRTKVFAEHVVWDKSKKSYRPNGPLLEVPKDYIGKYTFFCVTPDYLGFRTQVTFL